MPAAPRGAGLLRIGEVADRVALSLRTIRYYEEAGLVDPESRTSGGFRLYAPAAVARLELIKKMKPLGFSLEQMAALLTVLDRAAEPDLVHSEREQLTTSLGQYVAEVEEKIAALSADLVRGRELVDHLRQATGPKG